MIEGEPGRPPDRSMRPVSRQAPLKALVLLPGLCAVICGGQMGGEVVIIGILLLASSIALIWGAFALKR